MHAPVPKRSVDLRCIPKPFVADAACETSVHDVLAPILGESTIQVQDSITTTPPSVPRKGVAKKELWDFFWERAPCLHVVYYSGESETWGCQGGKMWKGVVRDLCRWLNSSDLITIIIVIYQTNRTLSYTWIHHSIPPLKSRSYAELINAHAIGKMPFVSSSLLTLFVLEQKLREWLWSYTS